MSDPFSAMMATLRMSDFTSEGYMTWTRIPTKTLARGTNLLTRPDLDCTPSS